MGFINSLLAQTTTGSQQEQIQKIYEVVNSVPSWAYNLSWVLIILTALMVAVMFMRQKKIATNQVRLAELIEQLIEKK